MDGGAWQATVHGVAKESNMIEESTHALKVIIHFIDEGNEDSEKISNFCWFDSQQSQD